MKAGSCARIATAAIRVSTGRLRRACRLPALGQNNGRTDRTDTNLARILRRKNRKLQGVVGFTIASTDHLRDALQPDETIKLRRHLYVSRSILLACLLACLGYGLPGFKLYLLPQGIGDSPSLSFGRVRGREVSLSLSLALFVTLCLAKGLTVPLWILCLCVCLSWL